MADSSIIMTPTVSAISYPSTTNIGDVIQSLVIHSFIKDFGLSSSDINREAANSAPFVHYGIINGWFAHQPEKAFPINIHHPLVIGFHLDHSSRSGFIKYQLDAFRKINEPIGCRDYSTRDFLLSLDLNAYFSGCPTICSRKILGSSLYKSSQLESSGLSSSIESSKQSLLCIDYRPFSLFRKYFNSKYNVVNLSAIFPACITQYSSKIDYTLMYLSFISNWKGPVLTTRLHVALPALSLGKSVIFYGDINNTRVNTLKSLGVKVNPYPTEFGHTSTSFKPFRIYQLLSIPKVDGKLLTLPHTDQLNSSYQLIEAKISDYLASIAG